MIKAITKSPMVRNLAIGAMFAGAVMGGQAAKPVSNPQTERSLQEQLMSSDASKALAAVVFSQSSSDVRNTAIDRKVMALAANEAERKNNKEYLDVMYSRLGTYFAAASLTSSLCDEYFKKAMDDFNKTEKPILRKRVETRMTEDERIEYIQNREIYDSSKGKIQSPGDYFCDCLDGSVYNLKYYYENTWAPFRDAHINAIVSAGTGKPTAKQVSDGVDKFEKTVTFFTAADHKRYNDEVKAYEATLGSSTIDQSNLIAFKVFLIDKMAIERNIKDFEMLKGNKNLMNTLKRVFDGNVKPEKGLPNSAPKFTLG